MQRVTFDWNKSQNYLPAVSLPKFMQEFSEHHTEFNRLLEAFLAKYNDIVTDMAFKQGDMFNRDDYPTVDQVRSKFGVSLFRNEVPLGDFRCQVAQDLADDMQVHYSRQAQQIVDGIMQDQMDRLLDVMQSIAHCCGVDEYLGKDGEMKQKKRKIYEGTIDKAKGLCQSYSQFNLTNDARLTEVVNELNIALRGIDAETLRESDAARSQVKDNVDEILSKFAPRTTV